MSYRVGDRLLIGILILIACFAVFVTISGQSPPTAQHGHCNPFDLDCDADATHTPKPTKTPRPTRPNPNCEFNPGTGEWECPVPTATPTPAPPTPTDTPVSPTPTDTPVSPTPTDTPVSPTPTDTPVSPTPTDTPVSPTPTDTPVSPTPTDTPVPPTPTDTPRPTPTPTPAPATPTGWIRAEPAEIVVGQTTAITAGWSNVEQEPQIKASSTSLATSCSGATGKSIIGPQQTQIMTGCSGGTVEVTLRNAGDNTILASVTVKVYPKPTITQHEQVAYRWLNIKWTGHPGYVYSVDWRPTSETAWRPLSSGNPGEARVNITGHSADIRGIPYGLYPPYETIDLRVVGRVGDLEVETAPYTVTRNRPKVSGHVSDHTIRYDVSSLPTSGDHAELGGWLRIAAPGAAIEYARLAYLWVCGTECTRNEDGGVVTVVAGDQGCGATSFVACVSGGPSTYNPDSKLRRNRNMVFSTDPFFDGVNYVWTNNPDQHGEEDPFSGAVLLWVKAALRHEFGHTFGLRHPDAGDTHATIMDADDLFSGLSAIQDADYAVLTQLYKGHTPNKDW